MTEFTVKYHGTRCDNSPCIQSIYNPDPRDGVRESRAMYKRKGWTTESGLWYCPKCSNLQQRLNDKVE